MKMFKSFNKIFVPKTFTFRILLMLLVVSMIPLGFLGLFVSEAIKNDFLQIANNRSSILEENTVSMYAKHIEEQSYFIDSQLKNVEHAVFNVRSLAQSIYSYPQNFPFSFPLRFVKEKENYYWEEPQAGGGNRGIIGQNKLTSELQKDLSKSKYLEPLLREEVENDANISAMYYIHPQSGFIIYPGLDVKKEVENQYMNPNVPLTSYHFYQDALKTSLSKGSLAWTKPYKDITHRNRVITATVPVYEKSGQLKGVVSADVTIDTLIRNILDIKFQEPHAYAFLLGKDRKIIAIQKNGESDVKQLHLDQFYNINPKNGYGETKINEQTRTLLSAKIPTTGWLLGYVIPKDEILQPLYKLTDNYTEKSAQRLLGEIMAIFVFMFLLCLILTLVIWIHISRPLKSLTTGFSQISEGNLNANLAYTNLQEFNHLILAFNTMSKKIQVLMREQIELNEELELKVDQRTDQLKTINHELMIKNRELIKMENWRQKLFANISHDLKTPLTLIKGYIEIILNGTIPPDQSNKYLLRIEGHVQSINGLVKDLNDLGLIETGKIQPHYALQPASQVFQGFIEEWRAILEMKGYIVQIVHPPFLQGFIKIDVNLIRRVIDNLVENAIKYSTRQTVITFIVEWEEGVVIFRIKDQGMGIPQEAIPFVFDRFYRIDKSRNSKIPGNGLGLSIAREIIILHGGEIWVDRNPDKGCTFSFSFPIMDHSM